MARTISKGARLSLKFLPESPVMPFLVEKITKDDVQGIMVHGISEETKSKWTFCLDDLKRYLERADLPPPVELESLEI